MFYPPCALIIVFITDIIRHYCSNLAVASPFACISLSFMLFVIIRFIIKQSCLCAGYYCYHYWYFSNDKQASGDKWRKFISFAASPSLPPLGETAWDRDHDRDRSRERNRERERERVRERTGENERERQQEREPAIREREARDRERERDRDRDRQRDRERDRERDVSVCMMEPPDSVFISPTAALLALQRIKDASLWVLLFTCCVPHLDRRVRVA